MRPLKKFSLYNIRTALLLFVLLPFLTIIIATGWYSLRQLEQEVQRGMKQEIELIAQAIRRPLSYALQHGHERTLTRTVTSIFDIDKVYAVYVYDKDGKRISTTGSAKARVADTEAIDLAVRGDEQGEFEEVGGEELYSYFMPLIDSGEQSIGLLQVTRRGSDFSNYIDQFRLRAVSLLVVSTLVIVALVWLGYHRAIGRHINYMRAAMETIAEGKLQHRVVPAGPAEIRFLAQGFNNMLDSIVASEQELLARREREDALKARLQQAEKLAAIGRFAAGVAHELGTPLSVADGKAQRELRHAEGKTAQAFTQIRQQLQRMERIIRQLMDFARPVQPAHSDARVIELVQSSLAQVEPEREQQQVQVALVGGDAGIPIRGDRLRLEQALINLLRNAIQATPGGQVHLHWQAHAHSWLSITVEDNGPGIDPQNLPHLLEPFFTTKPVGVGTGLGLAVVNAVITEHGGRIEVERSEFGGACFRLWLPIVFEKGAFEKGQIERGNNV